MLLTHLRLQQQKHRDADRQQESLERQRALAKQLWQVQQQRRERCRQEQLYTAELGHTCTLNRQLQQQVDMLHAQMLLTASQRLLS